MTHLLLLPETVLATEVFMHMIRWQSVARCGEGTRQLPLASAWLRPWSRTTCCLASAIGQSYSCLQMRSSTDMQAWGSGASEALDSASCFCACMPADRQTLKANFIACRRWLRPRTYRSQGFTFESYACAEELPSHRYSPSAAAG